MPIYAYKCAVCGHEEDVLQKISDAPLTQCPNCGAPAFSKQLTAAGFQLKGSGWYVTDFRNGSGAKKAEGSTAKPADADKAAEGAGNAAAGETSKPAAAPASPDASSSSSSSASPAPAPAPAPTSGSGGGSSSSSS